MPESPSPLLGRDILSKVHSSVFMNMKPSLSLPVNEQNVKPRVWADGKSVVKAQNAIMVGNMRKRKKGRKSQRSRWNPSQ